MAVYLIKANHKNEVPVQGYQTLFVVPDDNDLKIVANQIDYLSMKETLIIDNDQLMNFSPEGLKDVYEYHSVLGWVLLTTKPTDYVFTNYLAGGKI